MRRLYLALSLALFAVVFTACGHRDLIGGGQAGNTEAPTIASPRMSLEQSAEIAAPAYYAITLPSGFVAYAIMRDGQIAGAVGNEAAIYKDGTITLLASDPNCVSGTTATSVNTLGEAVGFCLKSTRTGARLALYFANGSVRELGDRFHPGFAEASTINDAGEIYGTSGSLYQSAAPFLTRFFATGQQPQILGESNSMGHAANVFLSNTGHFAYTNFPFAGPEFAAIGYGWGLSRLFPNQVGNSGVAGINDHDVVVGFKSKAQFNNQQTFVRTPGGGITFLPFPLGMTTMTPVGINNAGQVVGEACSYKRCGEIFFYSSGTVVDLTWRIAPKNTYTLLNGLSDSGDFIGRDPQGRLYLIEPTKPLFVANNFANNVSEYVPPYTGGPSSTTSYFVASPYGVAFDAKRNLFVSDAGNNDITEYAPPYTGEPIATIKNGISQPEGLTVDRSSGDLFVACNNGVQIYAPPYTGPPIAEVTSGVDQPNAVALDRKGHLFVSNIANSTITMYAAPYTGAPMVTIANAHDYPRSLALDARGDLFVGYDPKFQPPVNEVVEYAPPYTGAPIATITNGVNAPYGLAIDSRGNLFVANAVSNDVTAYPPPYTGSAFVTITTGVDFPEGLAFGP